METLQLIKQKPAYYELRARLFHQFCKSGKQNAMPHGKSLKQTLVKKIRQSEMGQLVRGLKQKEPEKNEQAFRFYQIKWTEMLLKNFSNMCEDRCEQDYIYSWSSFFNFLFLARDELVYNIREDILAHDSQPPDEARARQISKLLEQGSLTDDQLQRLARQGLTTGTRASVYLQFFQSALLDQEFDELLEESQKADSFLDQLLEKDVNVAVERSAEYFMFKEQALSLARVFVRDEQLLEQSHIKPHDLKERSVFRSGVVPCKDFSGYICPFFYLSQDLQIVYLLFREFYIRYWVRLHTIDSSHESIGYYLAFFRAEFERRMPELQAHLSSIEVKADKLAFGWIFSCFISELPVKEVLLILDSIVGSNSLLCLPRIAIGVFLIRKRQLLKAKRDQVVEVLAVGGLTVKQCLDRYFLQ